MKLQIIIALALASTSLVGCNSYKRIKLDCIQMVGRYVQQQQNREIRILYIAHESSGRSDANITQLFEELKYHGREISKNCRDENLNLAKKHYQKHNNILKELEVEYDTEI